MRHILLQVYPVPIILPVTLNRRRWDYCGVTELMSAAEEPGTGSSVLNTEDLAQLGDG